MESIVKLAEELIRIPGYAELPEKEIHTARYLWGQLSGAGLDARTVNIGEGRVNVECTLKGTGGGKNLLLCTHLDTVPAYEMPDAFIPRTKDGKLYGRGAVDVKGILAAMAFAMKRVKEERRILRGTVLFLGVADEESGSLGMRAAMDSCAREYDVAVIGEATDLKLGIAHKGVAWIEVAFRGVSTHGSTPEAGVNAVYHASALLEKVRKELIPLLDKRQHPFLGRSTINPGYISGGTRPTIVPDRCVIQFDRRLLPGEDSGQAVKEIRGLLEQVKESMPELDYEIRILLGDEEKPFPPMSTEKDSEAVLTLAGSVEKVTGEAAETIGLPFWTDGALFSHKLGRPVVVFGPGSIKQAHSDCEYVDISQLEMSSEVYYQMILDVCS